MTEIFTAIKRAGLWLMVVLLAACAHTAPPDDGDAEPAPPPVVEGIRWASAWRNGAQASPTTLWLPHNFPNKKPTVYTAVRLDGRDAVQGEAHSAASMLRQQLRVEPAQLGKVRFSWKVPALIPGADLTLRETDDSPVRVILAFDGDRSKFSAKNAMLSELALALTGEPLPYATLMYVWGNHSARDSVVINPRTDRIRKLVVESGPQQLNRWLDYERDVRADFEKAFGEAPGALVGVAIMTDADNTRQQATGWYGPISLVQQPAALAAGGASGRPGAP